MEAEKHRKSVFFGQKVTFCKMALRTIGVLTILAVFNVFDTRVPRGVKKRHFGKMAL